MKKALRLNLEAIECRAIFGMVLGDTVAQTNDTANVAVFICPKCDNVHLNVTFHTVNSVVELSLTELEAEALANKLRAPNTLEDAR